MCPDYKILPDQDANINLVQSSLSLILRKQLGIAVYKTVFLVDDYFRRAILISTQIKSRCVNFACCIDRLVELNNGKILVLKSAPN